MVLWIYHWIELHSHMTLYLLIIMVTYAPVNICLEVYLKDIQYPIVFLIKVQIYAIREL